MSILHSTRYRLKILFWWCVWCWALKPSSARFSGNHYKFWSFCKKTRHPVKYFVLFFGFALTRSWMSSCPPPSYGCWACNNDTQSVHLSTQLKVLTSFCRSASLSSWRTRGCMQRRRRSRTPPARMAAEGRKHHFAIRHSLVVPSNKSSNISFFQAFTLVCLL